MKKPLTLFFILLFITIQLTVLSQTKFMPSNTVVKMLINEVGECQAGRLNYFRLQACNNLDVLTQKPYQFIRLIHEFVGAPSYKNEYFFAPADADKLIQILKYITESLPKLPLTGNETYVVYLDYADLPKGISIIVNRVAIDAMVINFFLGTKDFKDYAVVEMTQSDAVGLLALISKARSVKWN